MTIKQSDASSKNDEFKGLEYKVEQILDMRILKETPDILEKIQDILRDVKNVNFNNLNPILLEGTIFDSEEIKKMIIEGTGYTRWELSEESALSKNDINKYKDKYNVDFKEKDINSYLYERSVNGRDEIYMLRVIVFPSVFYVEMHSGRAVCNLGGLLNEKEFVEELQTEFG